MSSRILIAYGTRYGATASTADAIATVLRGAGHPVTVVDTRREKVNDLASFDAVILGTGMQIGRWTRSVMRFARRHRAALAETRLAIFVSSGGQGMPENEAPDKRAELERSCLHEKVEKLGLSPMATAIFGGVWDFDHFPWWAHMAKGEIEKQIAAAELTALRPGFYDTRDWERIRAWARELAQDLGAG